MPVSVRRTAIAVGAVLVLALGAAGSAAADTPEDFAGQSFNVLPPGQDGGFILGIHTRDQIPLYDNLTPRFDQVTDADLPNFFKPATLGLGGQAPVFVEHPLGHPGVRIERDNFDVPHVFGDTRADVMFGAGYVAAEDRGLLMSVLRGPGRLAALDVPGINAFRVATTGRSFTPSQATENFMAQQVTVLQNAGPPGLQIIEDIDNYLAGINTAHPPGPPWTRNDVLGVAALIGAVFGKGGGDEARRSELLSALQKRLGPEEGQRVWNDLREQVDPEAPVSLPQRFTFQPQPPGKPRDKCDPDHDNGNHVGWDQHPEKHCGPAPLGSRPNVVLDDGSLDTAGANAAAVAQSQVQHMSNAVLVGASRSENGHPLFVAGPQVGYFYPQVLFETDLHGGGIDARGATFPGAGPYVQLGRGKDFSWSATSAGNDVIDTYVEKLCGSDTRYVFDGQCRDMTTFDAGRLGSSADGPPQEAVFRETVHGPVIGYATVNGERVAVSQKRATRGREVLSALGFEEFNSNQVHDPESFFHAASQIDFTFNWFYADNAHIAMYSSGRVPIRPQQVNLGLPTAGTGQFEWQGFLPADEHPHGVDPASGAIVNWNNKPARGWPAADSQWDYGSIYRSQLLSDALARRQTHTLGSVVGAMNRAATQDLRTQRVLPAIAAVLHTGPAPSARDARMLELLEAWRAAGSSRLDVALDGRIDDPGAAVMDAAWPKIADAVMSPVLGPQLDQLASLISRDNPPASQGSAYQSGWYGYVDKDLRTIAGLPVTGPFHTRFCGHGDLAACRDSLWAALDAAGNELAAQQGADPDAWRADATHERIVFQPGILSFTMRWTNRPTFQQAMSYSGHR